MVNYYMKFREFKEKYNLEGKTITLKDFESYLMLFYGLGTRKGARRWVTNFERVGFIQINQDEQNKEWMVKIL